MTLQDIIQALSGNADLNKQLAVHMASTNDGQELLNNHFKAEWDKKIGEEISKIHNSYDNDIFEVLGERKEANVKSYDFVKSLVGELKELRGKGEGKQDAKIKELESKLVEAQKGGQLGEHWKKIHDEAVVKFKEQEANFKEQLESKEKEFLQANVQSDLNIGRSGIKFMDAIPEEAINAMVSTQQSKILSNAQIIDGKVVYHKEDGTPWMNAEYKPISAKEIWIEKLGTIIKKEDSIPGGGANPNPSGGTPPNGSNSSIVTVGEGDKATKKLVLDKDKFSTKVEFNEYATKTLQKQGISRTDKDFNSLLDGAYKEYGISELETK